MRDQLEVQMIKYKSSLVFQTLEYISKKKPWRLIVEYKINLTNENHKAQMKPDIMTPEQQKTKLQSNVESKPLF